MFRNCLEDEQRKIRLKALERANKLFDRYGNNCGRRYHSIYYINFAVNIQLIRLSLTSTIVKGAI